MNRNIESFVDIDHLGGASPYKPTYDFDSYINIQHKSYAQNKGGRFGLDFLIDLGIDGWLQREDALKLYEMAYYNHTVLEIGTNRGLSTSVMARALADIVCDGRIDSIEINKDFHEQAIANLKARKLDNNVWFWLSLVLPILDSFISAGRKFNLVFVDHDHSYEATKEVIVGLPKLCLDGAFILWHDYLDPENLTNPGVGVYTAIRDFLLPDNRFEFWGCFGCMAMFRYRESK